MTSIATLTLAIERAAQAPRCAATASSRSRIALRVVAEVVEPRQRGEALEPEDALEELGRPVADGAADARLAPRFRQQASLDQPGHDRLGGDAAHAREIGTGDRAEVRGHGQRLECGLATAPRSTGRSTSRAQAVASSREARNA